MNTVTIPLWLWLVIFGMQLLGAHDWGDAAAAAGLMVSGFWLYRLQRVDGPHRSEALITFIEEREKEV